MHGYLHLFEHSKGFFKSVGENFMLEIDRRSCLYIVLFILKNGGEDRAGARCAGGCRKGVGADCYGQCVGESDEANIWGEKEYGY